ncbi:hypothetical protein TSMEX_009613 [Taenia solium]|eukprot:TsM_000693600 transcript=TsM_000693600 gene=TsM_000693600
MAAYIFTHPTLNVPLSAVASIQNVDSEPDSFQIRYTVRVYQEGEESVSELILPAAYWSFGIFGSYSCTAENRLGKATGYVRLKLATHPHCPNVTACTVG